jgi:hypothetical protein
MPSRRAAVGLVLAGAIGWLASTALAGVEVYENERTVEHYRHVAGHVTAWRIGSAGQLASVLAVCFGVVVLCRPWGATRRSLAGVVATGSAVVLAAMWTAEAAVRLTHTVGTAREIVAGDPVPTGFPGTWGIESSPVTIAAGLPLLVMSLATAVALRRSGLVGPRLGWTCTVTGVSAMTTDPGFPFLLCLTPLAVGVATRRRESARPPGLGAAQATTTA